MTNRDERGTSTPEVPATPGRRTARSPKHRPVWLVMLSLLTMMYGGMLVVQSLNGLRHPQAAKSLPWPRALTPAEEEVARQFAEVGERVVSNHPHAVRANALVALPVGLVMLFAAASALARDRRGRAIALAAGWLGIAHQLLSAALTYPVLRDLVRDTLPIYERFVALGGGGTAATPPALLSRTLFAAFVLSSAIVITGALIVIRYFGGRRGRILYGLEEEPRA
jgi:hypothetical protein